MSSRPKDYPVDRDAEERLRNYEREMLGLPPLLRPERTSTFTTSIWAAGISVSALLLKIASPLNYVLSFVRWLLPIESRPISAIGAVAAIIVWLGSVLYGLL